MTLPVKTPLEPMEALSAETIPVGADWQYEPKWDGFRTIAFKEGSEVALQSKAGQPLGRYFPEIVQALKQLKAKKFVLDGEMVVSVEGKLLFDELLMRIHPAASRVLKLSNEHPATYILFDLLVDSAGESLITKPLRERRKRLEAFVRQNLSAQSRMVLSPKTESLKEATGWFKKMAGSLDGVIAKNLGALYEPGKRSGAVQKIKNKRTADCVVGGFRRLEKDPQALGSLLLGLYSTEGKLDHVGFTSGFQASERRPLLKKLLPLVGAPGFTGNAPGGPSRWSTKRSSEWEPLKTQLVVEVEYDHFTGGRFRHGTRLLRWRPDKAPRQCLQSQVKHESRSPLELL